MFADVTTGVAEEGLKTLTPTTLVDVLVFLIPFVLAVFIDLQSHKGSKEPVSLKDATLWSLIWVLCSVAFGGYIWYAKGVNAGSLFAMGYVLEKALAVDNLFAFYLIFKSFGLTHHDTQHHQHRILYWGILGAIALRFLFLGFGAIIVNISPYILIAFALVVLWTVLKMWSSGGDDDDEVDYTNHWSVKMVKGIFETNPSIESGRFFSNGVTPLFLCLVCIEACDVVFAFDSMPVIVAVVQDPYLMITSSLWAAAGLRSLYFLLVAAQSLFWALDKAVMILLIFISFKLIFSAFHIHIPHWASLGVIVLTLGSGILFSLLVKSPEEKEDDSPAEKLEEGSVASQENS